MCGLISEVAGGGGHGAGRRVPQGCPAAEDGLKMTQSNKRMHATADTTALMLRQSCGAARDAQRWAASIIE
jgi:hypothetical protein